MTYTRAIGVACGAVIDRIVHALTLSRIHPNVLTFMGLVINIVAAALESLQQGNQRALGTADERGAVMSHNSEFSFGDCAALRFGESERTQISRERAPQHRYRVANWRSYNRRYAPSRVSRSSWRPCSTMRPSRTTRI